MCSNNPSSSPAPNGPSADSIDLFFQLMKDNITDQEQRINQLDTKANSALVAANALVTTGLVLQVVTISISSASFVGRIVQVTLLVILLITYALTMIYGIKGYNVREWKRAIFPVNLPDENSVQDAITAIEKAYLNSADQNKEEMNREMLEAYFYNKAKAEVKADSVSNANTWVGVETVVFILVLGLQVLLAFKIF